ncbi:ribosome maturation factor RimM [uncultured Veillonella sp.]|uniref:ribosome maturation factor RimM n=1 Tax=uncultured Veillonella sp. TaxID=159268 RepID=UPI00261C5CE7|nr:ribosome maturation factor RimM [uncultured Veillonella sp.]
MNQNELITIGVIVAPHGVRGDLRIMPTTDFPDRFLTMEDCYIDGKQYHITSARYHKQFILATFKEIPDRNAAELMGRKEIQVSREDLVELPEGRYYIFDIIGLTVFDTEGVELGKVSDVLQPGANDVYVVQKEGEPDLLLPVLDDVILEIDVPGGKIIANPPEWI